MALSLRSKLGGALRALGALLLVASTPWGWGFGGGELPLTPKFDAELGPVEPVNTQVRFMGNCRASGLTGMSAWEEMSEIRALPPAELKKLLAAGDGIALVALPAQKLRLLPRTEAFRVLLINGSGKNLDLTLCSMDIGVICEALDEKGVWRAIEYRNCSFCGNSYSDLVVKPGDGLLAAAPRYAGDFKTKLRFHLLDYPKVYSNEFEGFINRGQFKLSPDEEAMVKSFDDLLRKLSDF